MSARVRRCRTTARSSASAMTPVCHSSSSSFIIQFRSLPLSQWSPGCWIARHITFRLCMTACCTSNRLHSLIWFVIILYQQNFRDHFHDRHRHRHYAIIIMPSSSLSSSSSSSLTIIIVSSTHLFHHHYDTGEVDDGAAVTNRQQSHHTP